MQQKNKTLNTEYLGQPRK